ncbi:tyrosine-type recombinase/integrase [Gymnodinialimonas ceratoperidinii]|uniref:Integrase arm-type DNA-binding domain-containing protein n=1 Tax=Gymnodinialimonas ceratoperidinii TaxID=2856823 RepID=A0A8F6TZQ4_9RHOB|nr:site-specific integrase [Gymnodinialimonas ceratoperidinii]QXT40979.1 integrase arm-type DNA-binding domain-containing protein [Gymnodinialimonas ceratoperidinii]
MPSLTVRKVASLQLPGRYGDGNGLYLLIGPTGAKSWVLRTVVHGRRRDLGLGSAALVSLAEARQEAQNLRKIARSGGNPDTVRKQESLTFKEATLRVHKSLIPTWRSGKHGQLWLNSMENHVFPIIGDRPIDSVETADVMAILAPVWTTTPDTARRLKQRIALVFDWAKGAGHYHSENPVNGVKKALPKVKRLVSHRLALPWQKLPDFMLELHTRDSMSARALEFLILTATRSKECRFACWRELTSEDWKIPAERMKREVEHRIPLSAAARAVLERVRGIESELVFPYFSQQGAEGGKPQSENAFLALLKRMQRDDFTPHGFRSTFRDWCSECTDVSDKVAEAALSHSTGNETEQAYARSDLFGRRVELMEKWGAFATSKLPFA